MLLNDGTYLCPFCVSSWDCDGPHIEEEDLDSFYLRLYHIRQDLAELAREEILNNQTLPTVELAQAIYKSISERSPS
jgi:hypothetical protein